MDPAGCQSRIPCAWLVAVTLAALKLLLAQRDAQSLQEGHVESWCRVKGHPFTNPEEAIKDERIIARINREVEAANASLDKVEQVKKFALLPEPWTVEGLELSPTLKLKRKVILEKYKDHVEKLYV